MHIGTCQGVWRTTTSAVNSFVTDLTRLRVLLRKAGLAEEAPPVAPTDAELLAVHPNPKVGAAAMAFEVGEMSHMVDTCAVCDETRPVFHGTDPLSARSAEVRVRPSAPVPPAPVAARAHARGGGAHARAHAGARARELNCHVESVRLFIYLSGYEAQDHKQPKQRIRSLWTEPRSPPR